MIIAVQVEETDRGRRAVWSVAFCWNFDVAVSIFSATASTISGPAEWRGRSPRATR